jgi:hypothetical protein
MNDALPVTTDAMRLYRRRRARRERNVFQVRVVGSAVAEVGVVPAAAAMGVLVFVEVEAERVGVTGLEDRVEAERVEVLLRRRVLLIGCDSCSCLLAWAVHTVFWWLKAGRVELDVKIFLAWRARVHTAVEGAICFKVGRETSFDACKALRRATEVGADMAAMFIDGDWSVVTELCSSSRKLFVKML